MKDRAPILIVDDEVENLNLLENILGEEFDVLRAPNGRDAVTILKDKAVHLILTDQRMPGMSGVELLEESQRLAPDAVRMLITAYPDIEVAVLAINRGQVKRYIPKPFDPRELLTIVRQELEHFNLVRANRELNRELGRMVNDLVSANRRLRELDRMKDQFLASISHELKTPLVSGIGYIDLLLSGGLGKVDSKHEKGLRIAFRNLQRLLELIEDLLTLARMRRRRDSVRRSAFSLDALLTECVESLRARARKEDLRVTVKGTEDLPSILGEERAIHSVLTNILSNAEKFTPDKARIDVRVKVMRPDRCEVRVTDNGIGLPPGRAGDVIRLFREKEDARSKKYGGLGIGLMLTREILAAHGGSIRLEPRARGAGTVVIFDLPLAPPEKKKGRRGK